MARVSLLAKLGLDTKTFQKNMAKAQRSAKGFASKFGKLMGGLGVRLGAIGIALATKQMADLAIVAEETASKFGAVFKNNLDEMTAKMKELKETVPATTQEMQNALSTFGAMAKAFGMNEKEAGMFSVELVRVAGDLASFHNLAMEDAFSKLRSGLTGSAEPLMQLGIIAKQTEVKLEALKLGLIEEGEEMNALSRAMATHSLIVQQMGDAHGDAGITASSTANQLKFLRADIIDNATSIGNQLTPALAETISMLNDFVPAILKARKVVGEFIGGALFRGGLSELEFEAVMDLKNDPSSSAFEKQFGFSKKKIRERVAELKKEREEIEKRKEAEKEAERIRIENAQAEMRLAITAEERLEVAKKQIEVETDPRRVKALQHQIDFNKKLINMLKEREAQLTQGNKDENDGIDLTKEKEQIRKQELKVIEATATGNEKLIEKEEERLDVMEKTLELMEDHNLSKERALELANDLVDAQNRENKAKKAGNEITKGLRFVEDQDLGKIMDKYNKMVGEKNTRFERFHDVGGELKYRKFEGGSIKETLTVEDMRELINELAKQDNDELADLMKELIEITRGKMVSE